MPGAHWRKLPWRFRRLDELGEPDGVWVFAETLRDVKAEIGTTPTEVQKRVGRLSRGGDAEYEFHSTLNRSSS